MNSVATDPLRVVLLVDCKMCGAAILLLSQSLACSVSELLQVGLWVESATRGQRGGEAGHRSGRGGCNGSRGGHRASGESREGACHSRMSAVRGEEISEHKSKRRRYRSREHNAEHPNLSHRCLSAARHTRAWVDGEIKGVGPLGRAQCHRSCRFELFTSKVSHISVFQLDL
jgi:hypothetical protein